jgi:hypothetical protein
MWIVGYILLTLDHQWPTYFEFHMRALTSPFSVCHYKKSIPHVSFAAVSVSVSFQFHCAMITLGMTRYTSLWQSLAASRPHTEKYSHLQVTLYRMVTLLFMSTGFSSRSSDPNLLRDQKRGAVSIRHNLACRQCMPKDTAG